MASGAIDNLLQSVSSLLSSFASAPIVVTNAASVLDSLSSSLTSLLGTNDIFLVEGIVIETDAFTMSVGVPPGNDDLKRNLGDECISTLSRSQVQDLLNKYGQTSLAETSIEYGFNIYEAVTGIRLDSELQGISLRFISDSSIVDVSNGMLISIPISEETLLALEDDEEPVCQFLDPRTLQWRSDGLEFVRYGNDLDPKDIVKPQCIICSTTHFTGKSFLYLAACFNKPAVIEDLEELMIC